MVKLQKQTRGNFMVAIPKVYLKHCGWDENTHLSICPCGDGLKLVKLNGV